jgi:hypothetical protein
MSYLYALYALYGSKKNLYVLLAFLRPPDHMLEQPLNPW